MELLSREYCELNEVHKALDDLQNMLNDDDMEDASIYHKHLKVLHRLVDWRETKDEDFFDRYLMMKNCVVKSKYVLGTQYLRRIVVDSFDKLLSIAKGGRVYHFVLFQW